MPRVCPKKEKFRQEFMSLVEELPYGSLITDSNLKEFIDKHGIELEEADCRHVIWSMEKKIGLKLKKRLKRKTGVGYEVLQPTIQSDSAVNEGAASIRRKLKQTQDRLKAVDANQLSKDEQQNLQSRLMAANALRAMTKPLPKKLTPSTLNVLNESAAKLVSASEIFGD